MVDVRKGQAPRTLSRQEFGIRFQRLFHDPAFRAEQASIDRLEAIAWDGYQQGRKAPISAPAGPGYADPGYRLSSEWRQTKEALDRAQRDWADPSTPTRVLLICGSPRNDGTCPGEMSKTYRLVQAARQALQDERITTDVLDLSLLTSEYGRQIHPCKGCVSTAMPLCHWPCSCYPNHALGQVHDDMADIYQRWVSAHGVIIVAPTHWYQSPSVLKLMIDRLVCADGGNPDPTLTGGKDPEKAKAVELAGWHYPKHLAGRGYGVIVHGDVAGIEGTRRALCDWLDWMGLLDAGDVARLDRYIGYYEPYATSHQTLDGDEPTIEETRNVALAVAHAVRLIRSGRWQPPRNDLKRPRPK